MGKQTLFAPALKDRVVLADSGFRRMGPLASDRAEYKKYSPWIDRISFEIHTCKAKLDRSLMQAGITMVDDEYRFVFAKAAFLEELGMLSFEPIVYRENSSILVPSRSKLIFLDNGLGGNTTGAQVAEVLRASGYLGKICSTSPCDSNYADFTFTGKATVALETPDFGQFVKLFTGFLNEILPKL